MTDTIDGQDVGSDVAVITQVVLHERQGRDRGWWDQMLRTYWPDSTVHLSWYDGDGPGFVAGCRALRDRGLLTVHAMSAPVVQRTGHRALVEVSAAIRADLDVDGVAGRLVSNSRLEYRIERRDGEWRIRSLDAIYEDTALTPSVPGQRIEIPVEELARFRSSYAILAWDLARNGRAMSEDLLGDDEPEPVAAFYASALAWLAGAGE